MAHSFSASECSSSLASRVWDGPSVKAPLECPLQGFLLCSFLFLRSWGVDTGRTVVVEGVSSVCWFATDWDEMIKNKHR